MTDVVIRLASPADAPAIANLRLDSWNATYRGLIADAFIDLLLSQRAEQIERWQAALAREPEDSRTWVAVRDAEVLGFASTGPSGDEDAAAGSGEVRAIYLRPEAIGSGVGRALFAHAVEDLRSRSFGPLMLWVLRENARARRFYEAAGWQPDGAEKTEERPDALLHEVRYRAPVR